MALFSLTAFNTLSLPLIFKKFGCNVSCAFFFVFLGLGFVELHGSVHL
jgi:hypothetical protein